jgi:hypothetical protein
MHNNLLGSRDLKEESRSLNRAGGTKISVAKTSRIRVSWYTRSHEAEMTFYSSNLERPSEDFMKQLQW